MILNLSFVIDRSLTMNIALKNVLQNYKDGIKM